MGGSKHPPLSNKKLLKRLKKFDVRVLSPSKGKGSERILLREVPPGSGKGPQYTIKWHKDSDEQNPEVIKSILVRFNIKPDDFWKA